MASLVHSGRSVNLPTGSGLSPRLGGPISRSSSTASEHDYGKRNQLSDGSTKTAGGSGTNSPTPTANDATSSASSTSTVEQPMYTCKLNSSFTASTQFVSSLTTQNLDDVEQVLADYPEAIVENVAVEKQESPSKPNVVTQVVVIHPEDDEDEVVESAIRSITESLNRSAAEKIAKGESPPSETVIEIVRVKQPSTASIANASGGSSGYPTRDGGCIQDKQVFIHSPSKGGTLERQQQQRTGRLGSPSLMAHDEDERDTRGVQPRVATPSPPRYSAQIRRKPDLSATCYFDTQQQQQQLAPGGRKLLQRSVSYTVTKTAPQNVNMKVAPQILQRRHIEGSVQGYKQGYVSQQMPGLSKTRNWATEEMEEQQFAVDDADDEDAEDSAVSIDRLSSSGYGSSGMGYHDDSDASRRPAYSYMHLIQMAICSKADRRMTLREIYQWIEDQFPYYRHQINKGWKNSIRHNLSLYDIFVREKNKSPNHTGSSYWTVRPNAKQKHGGLRSVNRFGDDNSNGPQFSLVPKPPTAPATAYALIPIQSGLPAVPSKPYVVQPLADNSLTSGDNGSYDKRPRILKRTIRSVSPCYQKQPRVVLKPADPSLNHLSNSEPPAMATRSSYPPLSRSAASRQLRHQQQQHGDLLSISLNDGMLEESTIDDPYAQLDTSVTSDLRQRLSLMNVRSVAAIDVVDSNDTSSSNFDGSVNDDVLDTTAAVDTSITSGDCNAAVTKPKAYRSRKSKLLLRNCDLEDEGHLMPRAVTPERLSRATTPPLDVTPRKRREAGSGSGSVGELFDTDDIPELLSSLGHDLATPLRMLLSTPPKTSGDSFLSSTPISTLGDLPSPLGASLLCGFTPLSAGKFSSSPRSSGVYDLNIDSGIFGSTGITPFKLCEQSPPSYATRLRERFPSGDIIFAEWSPQAKGSTPLRQHISSPNSRSALTGVLGSPGIGSLRRLGLVGLTPQRGRHNSADDVLSPNDKQMHGGAKFLDGTPMEGEDMADDYLEMVSDGTWLGSCKKVD